MEFIENEAFENKINIKLFNEIIQFIVKTSKGEECNILKKIKNKCIWYDDNNIEKIQNVYKFEYFGELLERYEERIGDDIKDIRAICLAVGYARDLITENMIIGTQLVNFISKMKKYAEEDIYIKGALYLYNNGNYENELLTIKYTNTEDIFFVLSLFNNIEETFNILEEQLINLLGINRTISVVNNIKLYGWVINNLYNITKRKNKNIILLKKLVLIPTKQLKEDDDIYTVLYENGYTREEIAYMNYALLYYSKVPKTVRLNYSITEERIAINFCKTILNSANEQNQDMYELIRSIFKEYLYFRIKCNKKQGMKDAVIDEVNIVNPITFIEFNEILKDKIYSFDILDDKWNIIAEKLELEQYKNVFDIYLRENDFSKEKIEQCIKKYNELTNTSYIKDFLNYKYYRQDIFEKLVNKDIIKLIEYYEKYKSTDDNELRHLKNYVRGIPNKISFLFLQYLIEEKKYNIRDIDELGFEFKDLCDVSYSYYKDITAYLKKDFLSKEEKYKLFFWLDNYMFEVYPSEYINFIVDLLEQENATDIISKEQLREIYLILKQVDENIDKNQRLRNMYLTQEELEEIEHKENEEKERKRNAEYNEKKETLTNIFKDLQKQSIEDIYGFCDRYEYRKDEFKICSDLVKEYLKQNIEYYEINKNELINYMELMILFLRNNTVDIKQFKEFIYEYMEKEKLDNGNIKRAC